MNIDNKTTREQALEWFNSKASLEKTRLCDTNTEIVGKVRRWETLTGREIEMLYLSEHPTETESKKEEGKKGDILAKWYLIPNSFKPMGELRDCIMAEMGINVISDLEEENNDLKEQNKLLREALQGFVNNIENHPSFAAREHYKPFMDKAKKALNQ